MILGLSGGVDSSVVAALCAKAIGKQLTCVFVNYGPAVQERAEEVEEVFTKQFDVASISLWLEKGIARYDVMVDDGEGIFLFDGFGITTKDGASLLSLHFRIPDETAEYVAGL